MQLEERVKLLVGDDDDDDDDYGDDDTKVSKYVAV